MGVRIKKLQNNLEGQRKCSNFVGKIGGKWYGK